jgi:hypothetical protein
MSQLFQKFILGSKISFLAKKYILFIESTIIFSEKNIFFFKKKINYYFSYCSFVKNNIKFYRA